MEGWSSLCGEVLIKEVSFVVELWYWQLVLVWHVGVWGVLIPGCEVSCVTDVLIKSV